MYVDGLGVEKNYQEAIKLYLLSAEQNNSEAQNNIGYMYKNGLGVEINYQEAMKWFLLSSEQFKRTKLILGICIKMHSV